MSEVWASRNDAIDTGDIVDKSGRKTTTSAPGDKTTQPNESTSVTKLSSLNPDKIQRTGTKGKRTIHKRSTRPKVGRKVNKIAAVATTKETSQKAQTRRENKIAKHLLKRQTRQMDRALAAMSLDSQPALDTTESQISKREMKRRRQQAEHDRKATKKNKEDIALDE